VLHTHTHRELKKLKYLLSRSPEPLYRIKSLLAHAAKKKQQKGLLKSWLVKKKRLKTHQVGRRSTMIFQSYLLRRFWCPGVDPLANLRGRCMDCSCHGFVLAEYGERPRTGDTLEEVACRRCSCSCVRHFIIGAFAEYENPLNGGQSLHSWEFQHGMWIPYNYNILKL